MRLSQEQLGFYEEHGFLLLPQCFSAAEVARLKAELPALVDQDSLRRVLEKSGEAVRSIYGSHADNRVFRQLSCHLWLVEPARQVL